MTNRNYGANRAGISRSGFLRTAGIGAAGVVGAAMMGSSASFAGAPSTKGTLATVKKRGYLNVAIPATNAPGFYIGYSDPGGAPLGAGNVTGLEADLARAIAVAVLGPNNKNRINFLASSSTTRFELLASGEADAILRSCTNTYSRDAYIAVGTAPAQGYEFAPTYYYDGADVVLREDVAPAGSMYNIAIGKGTTTLSVVLANKPANWNIVIVDDSDVAKFAFFDGYFSGQVFDVNGNPAGTFSGPIHGTGNDTSALIGFQLYLSNAPTYRYFAETTGKTISKEPLAPVVREGDQNWSDIVRWVMNALIEAEERGVTSANVPRDFLSGLGPKLGLSDSFAYDVIRNVGNYGEIWNRNLVQPFLAQPYNFQTSPFEPRGMNDLYTRNGMLYSPAYR